jgi:hypothetical protein
MVIDGVVVVLPLYLLVLVETVMVVTEPPIFLCPFFKEYVLFLISLDRV